MMVRLNQLRGNLVYLLIATSICLFCAAEARRSTLAKNKGKVCKSEKCRSVAKRIANNMDPNENPCEDFYNYACGGWIKRHEIPKGKDEYSAIVELSERNDKRLKHLLKLQSSTDTITIKKLKDFYKSCLNTKIVDSRAEKPLTEFIKKLGSWDMFSDFDVEKWDFNKTLQLFHKEYPAEIFFTVDVDVDPKNRTMNIVTIDQAKLCLPQIVYYVNKEAKRELGKYAAAIAQHTGVPYKRAMKKMKEVVMFETKLAKISVPKKAKKYARTPIRSLIGAIPTVSRNIL